VGGPVISCICAEPYQGVQFKSGELSAGKYGVYKANGNYCDSFSPIVCAASSIALVRVGEITVGGITAFSSGYQNFLESKPVINFPNPWNGREPLRFQNVEQPLRASLFDISGRKIHVMERKQGKNLTWHPRLTQSGIYVIEITIGARKEMKKIIFRK